MHVLLEENGRLPSGLCFALREIPLAFAAVNRQKWAATTGWRFAFRALHNIIGVQSQSLTTGRGVLDVNRHC